MVGNGLIEKEVFSTYQDDDFWFVQINQIRELKNSFFTVATRENSLSTILEQAPNEIVIAPEHFSSQKKYIGIKAADTEYLEGSIDTVAKEPTFRFDFVLITVLDILQRAAAYLNTKITVSTIGFNFEINKSDREPRDKQYLQVLLKNQKSIFEAILSNPSIFPNLVLNQGSYRKDDVDYKKDSKNRFFKHKISDMNKLNNINNAKLKSFFHSASNTPTIVAEITNNHLGNTDRLIDMVDLCIEQGANFVKIQKRDPFTLYTKEELDSFYDSPFGKTLGDYRFGVELDTNQIDVLHQYCSNKNIAWFTSVLDLPSLELLKRYELYAIKIPSTVSNHRNFIDKVSRSLHELIVVSTGGASWEYIEWIMNIFKEKKIALMQCTSSYPCELLDCNIAVVKKFSDLQEINGVNPFIIGYSSHDQGNLASQLAVALGANLFEKHVRIGSVPWVHFDEVALDLETNELEKYRFALKEANIALGSEMKKVLPTEHHKYQTNKKHN